MHNHHSTCYIPGCANPRAGECGFCEEHRQAMRTPKQTVKNTAALPDYTHCPCGVPATVGETAPSSITPASSHCRSSLSTLRSETRRATSFISLS